MLYQYSATDQAGKKVDGSIDAPSLEQARQLLLERGFEILNVCEARQIHRKATEVVPQPSLKTSFAFEGIDESGLIRRGTVQAENKYEAYEQLREKQNLTLSMLSPVGITPQFHDRDLQTWQNRNKEFFPSKSLDQRLTPTSASSQKKFGFTSTSPLPTVDTESKRLIPQKTHHLAYKSLHATLRLYAGWLLAWYTLFVALGYYVHVRSLPFSVPFVEAFYQSSLLSSITTVVFLYLLLSTAHLQIHKYRRIAGLILFFLGTLIFIGLEYTLPS